MRVSNESREGLEFGTLARGLIWAAHAHVLAIFALALVSALDRRLEALAILLEAMRLLAAAAARVRADGSVLLLVHNLGRERVGVALLDAIHCLLCVNGESV